MSRRRSFVFDYDVRDLINKIFPYKCDTCKCWSNCRTYQQHKSFVCDSYIKKNI